MFCPKCGNQLPDGSQFCANCGEQLAPSVAAQHTSAPANAKPVNVAAYIEAFFALLCFIFGFLPLVSITQSKGSESYSLSCGLFSSIGAGKLSQFDINVMLGIAKILMIMQIVVFVVYLVSRFVDLNKFINVPFDFKKAMPAAYFTVYGLSLLFTLIACLIGYTGSGAEEFASMGVKTSVSPAVCWYIAVVLLLCFAIAVVKPKVFSGLIKQQ